MRSVAWSIASPAPGPRRPIGHSREEIAAAVERALRRLPERQRAAVVLQRFEGLSYDEIAAALGVSTDAVDALLRRAKVALRDALAPYRGA